METGISGRDWQFWIECFEYEASFVTGNVPESIATAGQRVAANGGVHVHSLSDVDRAAKRVDALDKDHDANDRLRGSSGLAASVVSG